MITQYKRSIVITVVSVFIGLLPLYAAEPVTKKPQGGEAAIQDIEISDLLRGFSRAYKNGEPDEYMSFYTARVIENGVNAYDKIKADYLQTIAHNIVTKFEFEISNIKVSGDYAIVDGLYNKILIEKSKGEPSITRGNVKIRAMKEDDRLKIAAIDYDNYVKTDSIMEKHIKNDYVIGIEDVMEVSVLNSPELSTTSVVRSDGMISIPMIGDIKAINRTTTELKEEIEKKMKEYKQKPVVSVIVKESNSQAIFITGEVARPGRYPLRNDTTVIQAITLAGGFTRWADADNIVIIRKSPAKPEGDRFTVNYSDIVSGKNMKANIPLKAGDTVIVP